ncbi:MAG: putative DNA-binding protein [Candidatus Solibacter sp.]|nr:putative DNA-binding protein [Candidatus Solibacter sp.]
MSDGELILYRSPDGESEIQLRAKDGTVWLTQAEIAELFRTTKQNISLHLRNVFSEGEILETSVVKEDLTTAADGKGYRTKLYRLEAILAVGYRVRSVRGTHFRQWATTALREYLVKGFVINDERLKDPGGHDYFDELLERIRDIRASEKRFYQKVREVFAATSADYDTKSDAAQVFFQTIQNKMLFAVTGRTAAELIVGRADSTQSNMGLTNWKGARVRKGDVTVAKNYLNQEEIGELNRIVTMFLDFAEDQTKRRKQLTMTEWIAQTDRFLAFNERNVLGDAGRVSHDRMESVARDQYETFDAARRERAAIEADSRDIDELSRIEDSARPARPKDQR